MTKISAASLVSAAIDNMKMPTGEVGDLAINVGQIKTNVVAATDLLYDPVGSATAAYNSAVSYANLTFEPILGFTPESISNKTDLMSGNTTSSIKYLSAKGVYDWATSTFGTGSVNSVSGTTNRITSTGGANPVIDIASNYVGQNTITTLGTITTGVWNGTLLSVSYGGTGTSTQFTLGSVIYAGASGVYSQNNSSFFWDNTNTIFYVGGNSGAFTNTRIQSVGTVNSYLQNNIINLSSGTTASGDWIATADDGTDITKYIDLGINSSGWSGTGMIDGQRQGYLYTKDVPLSIGTDGAVTLKFFTGGTASTNERISITSAGVILFTNNVQLSNFTGTWTASANNDYHIKFDGSFTSRSTNNDVLNGYLFSPTLTSSASNTQFLYGVHINPTLAGGGATTLAAALVVQSTPPNAASSGIAIFHNINSTSSDALKIINNNTGAARLSFLASSGATLSTTIQANISRATGTNGLFTIANGGTGGVAIQNQGTSGFLYNGSNELSLTRSVAASSGTGTYAIVTLNPTLNLTGTAVFTIRGYYYNPTWTSSTGSTNYAWEHTSGFVAWNSVLSPSQITSNQNDYNPTGWNNGGAPHGASILRLSTDASRNLTSLTGGVTGRLVIIANVGSFDLVITNDDGAIGTAANRFSLNANITLQQNETLMFWYDGTSSRWRACTNA